MNGEEFSDNELMREMNERYRDEELEEGASRQRAKRLILQLSALAIVLLFALSLAGGALKLYNFPSLSFLLESWELGRDPAVRELRRAVVEVETVRDGANASTEVRNKGSGFNLETSGLIVTNRHLVEDAKHINVSFPDSQLQYQADAWYWSDEADLAVILIEGEGLPVVTLADSYSLAQGENVTVIGNPLSLTRASSRGQVKRTGSAEGVATSVVEIAAPIHPGHSGSPVFNQEGEVVAVIFALVSGEKQSERRGLAVTVAVLEQFLERLDLEYK